MRIAASILLLVLVVVLPAPTTQAQSTPAWQELPSFFPPGWTEHRLLWSQDFSSETWAQENALQTGECHIAHYTDATGWTFRNLTLSFGSFNCGTVSFFERQGQTWIAFHESSSTNEQARIAYWDDATQAWAAVATKPGGLQSASQVTGAASWDEGNVVVGIQGTIWLYDATQDVWNQMSDDPAGQSCPGQNHYGDFEQGPDGTWYVLSTHASCPAVSPASLFVIKSWNDDPLVQSWKTEKQTQGFVQSIGSGKVFTITDSGAIQYAYRSDNQGGNYLVSRNPSSDEEDAFLWTFDNFSPWTHIIGWAPQGDRWQVLMDDGFVYHRPYSGAFAYESSQGSCNVNNVDVDWISTQVPERGFTKCGTNTDALAVLGFDEEGTWIIKRHYLDSWHVWKLESNAAPEAANHFVSVDNLVGFDVDPKGTVIITREAGSMVKTYGAQTLTRAGSIDSKCNQVDAVAASRIGSHVVYLACKSDNTPEGLRIRSALLDNPSWPSGCGFAPDAFDVNFNADLETLLQLARVDRFDIDFGNCDRDGLNEASFVLAFSTTTGKVGAYGKLVVNNFPDDESVSTEQLDISENPKVDDLCAWTDNAGQRFVGGVTENGPTHTYTLDVSATGASQLMRVEVDEYNTGFNDQSGAIAIACAGEYVALGSSDGVQVVDATTFQAIWTNTNTSVDYQAMAMSGDSKFLAWQDFDGLVHVSHTANGTHVGRFVAPSGASRGLRMDFSAQNLWVATQGAIAHYSLTAKTTGTFVAPDPPLRGGTLPGSEVDGSQASSDVSRVTGPDGSSVFGTIVGAWSQTTRLVISLLFVGVLAGIAYWLAGPAPMVVGGASALGMAISVPLFGFPIWIPITIAASGLGAFAAGIARQVGGARR